MKPLVYKKAKRVRRQAPEDRVAPLVPEARRREQAQILEHAGVDRLQEEAHRRPRRKQGQPRFQGLADFLAHTRQEVDHARRIASCSA